jgi:agmatinase
MADRPQPPPIHAVRARPTIDRDRAAIRRELGWAAKMPIDPLSRWRDLGEKPDFAGLPTFAGRPYTEDPADLADADIAILGAPMDDLVSDRPGTRFGPRAIRSASCPPGTHLAAAIDPFEELRVVDFGDAAVVPGDPRRSHEAIETAVGQITSAGALPIVLGGDHGITEPILRACHRAFGPVGLVHFDAHTDTGSEVFGATLSHGTPMRKAVEARLIDPARYVQIGLRGYWPPPHVMEWQREVGITSYLMEDIRERGLPEVVTEAAQRVGTGSAYVSIDIDVLDPAFAPGTGTPEPGGLRSDELLTAVRDLARKLDVIGADVVEVAPTEIGTADVTALVADRIVREVLTGIASRHADQKIVGGPASISSPS